MARTLTLTLYASYIKQAVKSDTYITGQIDKSADMVKNAALAFNEQAGDESYHNMKLYRTLKGALAKFEAQVAEYVETSSSTAIITDNLASDSQDMFTITITVGDRTSAAFEDTLAYLAMEYIINMMLYYWWQPIKPSLAKDYLGFSSDNILDVKRCLSKSAPTASSTSYPDIHGSVTVPPFTKTYTFSHPDIGPVNNRLDDDGYLVSVTDITNNLYTGSTVKINVGSTSQTVTIYAVSHDLSTYTDDDLDTVTSPTPGTINERTMSTILHMDSSDYLFFVPANSSGLNGLTLTITNS